MSDNEILGLDDEHTKVLRGYTEMQLRYLVNRLVFPELPHAICATSAGYKADHAHARAPEINRKDHVRKMFARCNYVPRDDVDETVDDMTAGELISWHATMVHNPEASIKEQQASAIELARLKAFHKTERNNDVVNFAQLIQEAGIGN